MALVFDSYGSGQPLVLLHGTGSHRGMWDPIIRTVARERRVIALDIPGFAGSAAERELASAAQAYVERARRLGLDEDAALAAVRDALRAAYDG